MFQRARSRKVFGSLGLAALSVTLSGAALAQPMPGSVAQEKPSGPKDERDADSVAVERDVDRDGENGARPIDLAGARIGYAVRGGLLAVDNLLLIDDDGTVTYRAASLAVEELNFEIEDRLSPNHVRILKQLVKEAGFASMPDRFEGEGIVIDGVDMGIAARLGAGVEKTVWSHSAAIEEAGFTRLRNTLDLLVAELVAKEVLKIESFSAGDAGESREFRLRADGRFRIEIRSNGEPLHWGEGRLSAAERAEIEVLLGKFDFASSRLCRSGSGAGEEHELFLSRGGERYAVQFRSGSTDGDVQALLEIVGMVKHAAESIGL